MSIDVVETKYYKVLRGNLIHYKFKYQLGMNVDKIPFNPTGTCNPGGLYYTTLEHIHRYLNDGELVAEVEPKGLIYADPEGDVNGETIKWKTDKLFVKCWTPIGTWLSSRPDIKRKALMYSGWCLRFITSPTYEEKMIAVQSNGFAIRLISDPDNALKLAAVTQNGLVLRFVSNATKEMEHAAVSQNQESIRYAKSI